MNLKKRIFNFAQALITPPRTMVSATILNINYNQCLCGKKILVIGGSKGIGRAIVEKCLHEGSTVIATGRNIESLNHLEKSLGNNIIPKIFDNSDVNGIAKFINSLFDEYLTIDSIVLNAGVSLHEGDFRYVTVNSFEKQIDINLKSHYFFAQSYIKELLERKQRGNVLFVSSETSAKSNDLPYGLSKVAVNSLVGGLARRVVSKGIRVNAIAPGVTLTDMTSNDSSNTDDISNNSTLGRFIMPQEIANVAVFLLSDASQCISGDIIYCDAGSHLKINGIESDYSIK